LTNSPKAASARQRNPKTARLPDERLMHQEIIAREYLKGRLQSDIAANLGVSLATVKRDLAKVRGRWLDSALRDFDTLKAEQLAKIDAIEAESWEMWSRSCEVQVRTSEQDIKTTKFPGRNRRTDRILGTGDPRYLQTSLQCVEKRCKLLGLHAPEKITQTDSKGNDVDPQIPDRIQDMSQEEIEARLRELNRKEMDEMSENEIRKRIEDITRGRFTATSIREC
jgi:hypothetical protein